MINFYIKGRFLAQPITGVQRFAREIVGALDGLAGGLEWPRGIRLTVAAPPQVRNCPEWRHIETQVVGRMQGQLWEQIDLPIASRDGAVITLSGPPLLLKQRQLVVIHDAAVFDAAAGFTKRFSAWYRLAYKTAARRECTVITVSEFSRQRLSAVLGIPLDSIQVVYNGCDHMGRISESEEIFNRHPHLRKQPYVLAVGSTAPNKNYWMVAEAARQLAGEGIQFAVVGRSHPAVFGTGAAQQNNLIMLGYVSDRDLKALYRGASCFIFPSLYEGFGIPALEAMSCGCPVIASNRSSLPEVCGDAALLFDPHSVEELSSRLRRVLGSQSLRDELRLRGQARAAEFTWERSARRLLRAIESHVEGSGA